MNPEPCPHCGGHAVIFLVEPLDAPHAVPTMNGPSPTGVLFLVGLGLLVVA